MNTALKLCLVYIIFITWNKAGHADGVTNLILNGLGGLIFIIHLFQRKFWKVNHLPIYIPIVTLTIISIVSYLNPRYRVVTINDLTNLKFEKVLLQSNDPSKVEMMTRGMNLILDSAKTSPSTSISLFFYFKNQYIDKYGFSESDIISNFFNNLNDNIELPFHSFLPTTAVRSNDILESYYKLWISLFIGIVIFRNIQKTSQIEKIAVIFSFNFIILCLIGFYQNYNQLWTDDYLEILGIWDAPEPRYFFSTFTYKNHWSAYALMMIFCLTFLLERAYTKIDFNHFRSKVFVLIIISIIIGSSTIFFSGSRSGSILLIISGILLTSWVLKNKFHEKYNLFLYSFLFLPIIIFVFFLFQDNAKWNEMKTTSKSQVQHLMNGSAPLRWYFWNDTIEIVKERPLWGHGYNSFSSIYPKFQSHKVRHERSLGLENAHNYYVPLVAHAHNDLLEFTAEWGLVGMFSIFLPFVFHLLVSLYSQNSNSCLILCLGCIVFISYCLIDFPTRTPACLANFCALFALSQKYRLLTERSRIRK